jgi:hypothetical protein
MFHSPQGGIAKRRLFRHLNSGAIRSPALAFALHVIDAVVPKDWDVVVGGGHQAYFNTQMRQAGGAHHDGP